MSGLLVRRDNPTAVHLQVGGRPWCSYPVDYSTWKSTEERSAVTCEDCYVVLTRTCQAGVHGECPHRRNAKRSPCDCTCHQTGS